MIESSSSLGGNNERSLREGKCYGFKTKKIGHTVMSLLIILSTLAFIIACALIAKPMFKHFQLEGEIPTRGFVSSSRRIKRNIILSSHVPRSVINSSVVGLAHREWRSELHGTEHKIVNNEKDYPHKSTRLPGDLIPTRYFVDFDIDLNKDNFTGVINMKLMCENPTNKIIFHGRSLQLINVTVLAGSKHLEYQEISYISEFEMFIVQLTEMLEEDSELDVLVEYKANYNKKLGGVYKSFYTENQKNRYVR